MFNSFYKHISFKYEKFNNVCIYIKNNKNYYLILHLRLSSNFFVNQLADAFSYEIFSKNIVNNEKSSISKNTLTSKTLTSLSNYIIVYNFHNLISNSRLFIFIRTTKLATPSSYCSTVAELYANANWLEREVAELYGLQFTYKKDLRNLMLQYGDTSTPFRKSSPSIGFRETSYDVISDTITQNKFDLQN